MQKSVNLGIDESFEKFGSYTDTVHGDSMYPFIRQEIDYVTVLPAPKKLNKYDVVLFKRPTGQYVLHRITKIKHNSYIICGDNRFLREDIPNKWVVGILESVSAPGRKTIMTDDKQVRYAKCVVRSYWIRRVKHWTNKLFYKLFHRKIFKVTYCAKYMNWN
jgi:hypothetical protein